MVELPAPPTPTLDAIYNAYEASQGDGFRDHLGASLIGKGCPPFDLPDLRYCAAAYNGFGTNNSNSWHLIVAIALLDPGDVRG